MLTLINRAISIVFLPSSSENLLSQIVLTVFRVVCGFTMIHNGLDKFADIPGFAEAYVEVIGLPFPIFFAYIAAATETIGSILVIVGLGTRLAALGLVSTMVVAMYHHILVAGFSVPYLELSMVYGSCFLFLTVLGAGKFSMDALVVKLITKGRVESLEASLQTDLVAPEPVKANGWGSYLSR